MTLALVAPERWLGHKNFKWVMWPWPRPSKVVCHPYAGTCYGEPMYQFEVSSSTCYEGRKCNTKRRKWDDL